jgi:hypothetical protein
MISMGSNQQRRPVMAQFDDLIKATGLPEAAVKPIRDKFMEAFNLITENNKRVAQVNAAKAQDPSKPGYADYLDTLWRTNEKDPAIAETVEQFDIVSEQYEKLLKQLREHAKGNFIPEQLSEDAQKATRKLVNESSEAIQLAVAQASAMVAVLDSMLAVQDKTIEGGVISLLPQVESLKNVRGRKAGGNVGGSYMTRTNEVLIDGVSTNIDGKGKLNYAADRLSELWNATTFPENKVTGKELEEALFEKLEAPFRSVKSTDLPESTTFDFTKEIKVEGNKTEARRVSVTVKRYTVGNDNAETAKPAEKVEAPAEKVEPKPVAKIDTRTVAQKAKDAEAAKANAPAKK